MASAEGRAVRRPQDPLRRARALRLASGFVLAASLSGLLAGAPSLERLGELQGTRACSFRSRTGLPCMGCGGTHALALAARGDVPGALAANPLGAWAGLAAWLLVLGAGASALTARRAFLGAALVVVALVTPVAFLWNAVSWWMSLPAGALLR